MARIEHNIPIPPTGRPHEYPEIHDMQVGDSIVTHRRPNVTEWSQQTGYRFSTRMLDDGSCRVWRIAERESRHA